MDELQQIREKIDAVDDAMCQLFEQRMDLVKQVVEYKRKHHLPVLDAKREGEMIERHVKKLHHPENARSYQSFLEHMMRLSRTMQNTILHQGSVAYQGTDGAFSHVAARRLFPEGTLQSYATFEEVMQAVREGKAEKGVLPFENSYAGEVGEVLDLLITGGLYITEIYDLAVDQNLLGVKGAKLEDVKKVYTHPQAIAQCRAYLMDHHIQAEAYPNTALAAKLVSEKGDPSIGAVASEETATLYDLEVLAGHINARRDNTTRFIVVERQQGRGDHFCMMFSVKHQVGQLAKAMEIFGKHGFNLESIKSRPMREKPWEYYFVVQAEGNLESKQGQEMLGELKQTCSSVSVLGMYQKRQEA